MFACFFQYVKRFKNICALQSVFVPSQLDYEPTPCPRLVLTSKF